MNIVLIGLKACGKTSVGNHLMQLKRCGFVDTDQLIEANHALTCSDFLTTHEIYQCKGERYFRTLESNVITCLEAMHRTVIATGGGVILDPTNIRSLKKKGVVVYLQMSFETFKTRLQAQDTPAFIDPNDPHAMQKIYEQRAVLYQQAADIEIATDNKSIQDISTELMATLEHVHGV